ALMAEGKFFDAEATARKCKVGESQCPAGKPLLAALSDEKQYFKALEEAEAAMDKGELAAASRALENAKNTKYQRDRLTALDQQRRKLVEEQIAKKPVEPPKPPTPPPAPMPNEKVAKLLKDARQAIKEGQYTTAIELLSECLKTEKTNPDCTVLLGSAFASRGSQDTNSKDMDKAREYYRKFLDVAPAGDKRRAKVEELLKTSQ
ncbi:MAG: hypothetical protein MUC96_37195, partial [Myxococcaceae bacterium]|nr:hypothetical protein [Myxococcaceae bacterium]